MRSCHNLCHSVVNTRVKWNCILQIAFRVCIRVFMRVCARLVTLLTVLEALQHPLAHTSSTSTIAWGTSMKDKVKEVPSHYREKSLDNNAQTCKYTKWHNFWWMKNTNFGRRNFCISSIHNHYTIEDDIKFHFFSAKLEPEQCRTSM